MGAIRALIVIIVIIIVVVGIIAATRSKQAFHSGSGTEGMSITRRVWLYLISLISLGIFAAGVGQLLTLLFDITIKGSSGTQVGGANFHTQQLSLGLAMTVIGGPLWFFFWRAVQRRVKGNREEIGSAIRKLFLNLILLETAIMGLTAASRFLKWLLSGASSAGFSPSGLGIVIVAGIIWFYFWRVSEVEGHPSPAAKTLRRWYVYILAGFGMIWLAVGLVQLINTAVSNLPVWGDMLVRGQFWSGTVQLNIAQILLGAAAWYFHWFRMAKDDFDSALRQVYFYLLAIAGGAVTALVASAILLFRFFVWAFGGVSSVVSQRISSSPPFQFLGWAVPTILVGLAIWGYHSRLVQEEAGKVQEKRQSAQRVYYYLMLFLGLGTLAAGLTFLFGILIDTGSSLTATSGWWRTQLALSLSLLLIGTPLRLYYWNRILKRMQSAGNSEWRALSRRIFLYVIIGASIITLTADLVNIVYQLLRLMMQGNFSANFLHNSKWSLQTLVVAAALLWYHWLILRADQRLGAESLDIRRNVTLLTGDHTGELASRLEGKLGIKIHTLYQVGQTGEQLPTLPDEEIDKLANQIQSSPGDKVIVVVIGGKVTVLPYQDK